MTCGVTFSKYFEWEDRIQCQKSNLTKIFLSDFWHFVRFEFWHWIFSKRALTFNQGWAPRSFAFWTHCSFAFFFEFLATYETPTNVAFFCILFLRTQENACSFLKNALSFIKNARELMFFYKEYTRAQENAHSFEKNAKERKRTRFLLQRAQKNACPTLVLFFNIYI